MRRILIAALSGLLWLSSGLVPGNGLTGVVGGKTRLVAAATPDMTDTPTAPSDPTQPEVVEIRDDAPVDILADISVGTGGQNAEQQCEYTLGSGDPVRTDIIEIYSDSLWFQIKEPAICSDQDMVNTQPYAVSPSGNSIKLTPYTFTYRDQTKINAATLPLIAYMQPGVWRLGTKNPAVELQIQIPVPDQPFFLRGRGDTSLLGGFKANERVKAVAYTFKQSNDNPKWIYRGVITLQIAQNGYRLLTVPNSHEISFVLVGQQHDFLMANAFFENNGNGSSLSLDQQEALYKAYWSGVPPTSAAGGIKTRTDSHGAAQVSVPAGCFMMGSPNPHDISAQIKDQTQRQVCLTRGYWIDRYEVSNAAYQQFVAAGGYQTRDYWSAEGWQWLQDNNRQGPTDYANMGLSDPQQPRVGVSLFEAEAYARWRGGHITTEAEWEYAARGPQSLIYPWGNTYFDGRANIKGTAGRTVNVQSYPEGQSWVGAFNLAGNVGEWVSDCFNADYDASMVKNDPVGPCDGRSEMVKGSSWAFDQFPAQAAYRFVNPPLRFWFDVGIRVVSQ